MNYAQFVIDKTTAHIPTGLTDWEPLPESLFPHQRALTEWALRRGRAAIFADTGLGKTRMQLAWAQAVHESTGLDVIILAPLAVAAQTAAEGREIGITVNLCRDGSEAQTGITITNYDRLHRFDASRFGAVVLDESSCIKHHDTRTLKTLLEAFAQTPFKLCATATPAPNDWTELGTHAEFLGVCSRVEMLSEYFVHDGGDTQSWRLKGHAKDVFWRWVSSWGAMVRKPSDLGFSDDGYDLPALNVYEHITAANHAEQASAGMLFALEARTLSERRAAKRASIENRVADCAALVNSTHGEPWLIWCDLNAEADALKALIGDAVEVRGPDDIDVKEKRLMDFTNGAVEKLISKTSICGWGMNWQHCWNIAFVGVTDSFESYYQAVRRCWRFGQMRAVNVHIFASELEGAVVANLKRKEQDAMQMAESLSRETRESVIANVLGQTRTVNPYVAERLIAIPHWLQSETEHARARE